MRLVYFKKYYILLIIFMGLLCDTFSIGCNSRLLADRILVPDTSFHHSSAATFQHGASAAREDPNDLSLQERAWCPDAKVGRELREFMEIDLGRQSIIKLIITKGRVAQSKGRQTTPYFYIKYRRELTSAWFDYEKENGTKRLAGNQDAMTENFNTMDPPFVARYIRIYPYSLEPTKTCLKLELLGCEAHGILEYKAPEGALLPETISPSHQQYDNNPFNERTRLLDTTYDSKSNKLRLFDSIQNDFTQEKTYQTITEGGLGKLTDNDTEFKTSTSPFSSHKFIGWRRKSPTRRLDLTTLSTKSIVNTMTSNSNTEMELDFLRLIFRFDMIYNFSSVRIYASNDFLVGLTIPRNVTIGFSFQDPSFYYHQHSHSKQQKREQKDQKNLWSSSILYQLTPDKQNTDSRWIILPIHGIIESNHAILSVTKQTSDNPGQLIKNDSDVEQLNIFGLGQFVEIRIFFNSQWLAIGEILFENLQMPNLKFQPEISDSNELLQQESQITTTTIPYLLNEQSSTINYPLGQTTTYILAIICSLLIILICFGLFCLFCVWGRERLRAPFRHKFKRTNKRFNDSTQFGSNLSVNNKSNAQNVSLLTDQLKINNLVVVTTTNDLPRDIQYQFQHPQRCQESTTRLPSTTGYLSGFQFLNNNGISPIGINFTTNSLHQPFQSVALDNTHNYPTYMNSTNLFGSLSNEVSVNLTSKSTPCMKSLDPKDSIPILPILTPNFIPAGSITPNFHGTFLRSDENMLNNINYHKVCHDNSIYTSLPGSDCDSQPYAKVDTMSNTMMQHFQSNNSSIDLSQMNIPFNHCNGESRFINGINLPPPPSLPLPPTPEHLSTTTSTITSTLTTSPQTISLRNRHELSHDLISMSKHVNNTLHSYNTDVNKCIPNNDITTWLDSSGQFVSTPNPLFDHNLNLDSINLSNVNNFQNISGVPNLQYSNSTTNGSNTYSAYYGTLNMLPISIPAVQMITIKR
ncbi:Discoidin domain-containing receptor 2 [Schistosoma japonicum]|uniref:Discoidin domain-containing receptor 2 n=1 Tax=Schistosoma japonicum TaxID=6182 RepID=A0A4Z2DUG5_SCHJA|nr:Discoidin domain-containing receptor 2 [Schistosoma japonicum]